MKILRSIIDQLKIIFIPKQINHGRIYDAIREMNFLTAGPLPDETTEQWEANFIKREGTREQFIKERTKNQKEDK